MKINFRDTDKRHADYTKDHQSTDLFLKGLYLSFFENSDLNQLDHYQTHERAEIAVRKRKSPINFGNFATLRNNNQLTVNSSKLATSNETNDINQSNNNETETDTTKTGLNTDTRSNDNSFKDAKIFNPTLTFDTPAPINATHEPRTLNNTEPFLIQVY